MCGYAARYEKLVCKCRYRRRVRICGRSRRDGKRSNNIGIDNSRIPMPIPQFRCHEQLVVNVEYDGAKRKLPLSESHCDSWLDDATRWCDIDENTLTDVNDTTLTLTEQAAA